MATYYRWRRCTVQYTQAEMSINSSGHARLGVGTAGGSHVTLYYGTSITIESDGSVSLNNQDNLTLVDEGVVYRSAGYLKMPNGSVYRITQRTAITYLASSLEVDLTYTPISGDTNIYYVYASASIGTFVEYVYSTNANAYPMDGASGNYYYDQRTTVTSPTAPSGITYPAPITTPSVSISWTAATSATNYPVSQYEVSYSTNGGTSWTVVGTTASTSYSVGIPAGTTSVMFRVRARDTNNQYGDYVTGTASQVLIAPTLTVPQMVMQGQQATIKWTAVDGADSYTLQRKSSADADWTQVYSGADLSYTETVGTWTSLQYRVQAVFGDTPGGWATSGEIQIVSASALVISGSDGDLGTVVNDIPYSISTDTGNQITATITVNSAVIFSGNVGNSTAGVIPVLDLVNGEGTIVIEASVQATSGTVSAVRTWTYTKAPITFPNALAVAQLTQNGVNIAPKTLAECVRLPGGKTLDKVMGFPCQIYTGSYVGTGTYGADNPNTLTFPFEPKFLLVMGTSLASVPVAQLTPDKGVYRADAVYAAIATEVSGGEFQFWSSTASYQMNAMDVAYYYIALG